MAERTIEDRLREEYFDLLPSIRKVAEQLEAEVKFHTLPISRALNRHERLVVTSRIKDCDSALESLRRRQEGSTFDSDHPDLYSLLNLCDLAGVRVLAFPPSRLQEIDIALREHFSSWKPDPVLGKNGVQLAYKYSGSREALNTVIQGEYQIASMLIGLFWEIEHSAIYKPPLNIKKDIELEMHTRTEEVYKALRDFEEEFERQIR